MRFKDDQLNEAFDQCVRDCHLCGRWLAFANYANLGARGAREVDHSVARARGGTDRLADLRPACISCNRSKRDGLTRSVRRD